MHHVYSTLSQDTTYVQYAQSKDLPVIEKQVLIKGGANVATKNLVTPHGIMTSVTDDELKVLMENPVFKLHMENNFIKVEKKNIDVEKAIKTMEPKDRSAPRTPDDYKNSAGPKPKI